MSSDIKNFKSVNNRLAIARKYGAKNTSKIVQDCQDTSHNTSVTVTEKRHKRKNDSAEQQLPPKKQKYSHDQLTPTAEFNKTRPLQSPTVKVSQRTVNSPEVEGHPSVKRCSSKREKYDLSERLNKFRDRSAGKDKLIGPQKVISVPYSIESRKNSRRSYGSIVTSTPVHKHPTKLNMTESPISKFVQIRDQQKLTPNMSTYTDSTQLKSKISFEEKNSHDSLVPSSCTQLFNNRTDDVEMDNSMDWSPVNEQDVISDILQFRENVPRLSQTAFPVVQSNTQFQSIRENDSIYVVVDTNVFITQLCTIKNIISLKKWEKKVVVYVPWMVLQELDYFKSGYSKNKEIKRSSMVAIKFINEKLSSKCERLQGQTILDSLNINVSSSNPDDTILFCCMKLSETVKHIILLSNDINLRNKALVHSVLSYGSSEIINKLSEMDAAESQASTRKEKIKQVEKVFTDLCNLIISKQLNLVYDVTMFELVDKPPWSLKRCIEYLNRFWVPVFSIIIDHNICKKVIDDFLLFLNTHQNFLTNKEDSQQFVNLCLSLCSYFKNHLIQYNNDVKRCVDEISDLRY